MGVAKVKEVALSMRRLLLVLALTALLVAWALAPGFAGAQDIPQRITETGCEGLENTPFSVPDTPGPQGPAMKEFREGPIDEFLKECELGK